MKCLIIDDDEYIRIVLEKYVDRIDNLQLIQSCPDAIVALDILQKEQVDLIFLDVEMPELSGMNMLKSLTTKPLVIIVTSHKSFAAEAYDYDVLDYIVKPVDYGRFFKAVEKAQKASNGKTGSLDSNYLFVKSNFKSVRIDINKIMFVEAMGNYVQIYTVDEETPQTVHSTMKKIEEKLPQNDFVRVHKSHIVRIDKIEFIQEDMVQLEQKWIPIGKSYKKELESRLNWL
ncbi:response regulator transcription factor [bacterium AH-315-C07]|nr:response regulator transcription factor [bacterium AH-315-C07]